MSSGAQREGHGSDRRAGTRTPRGGGVTMLTDAPTQHARPTRVPPRPHSALLRIDDAADASYRLLETAVGIDDHLRGRGHAHRAQPQTGVLRTHGAEGHRLPRT
eukprot:scaffold207_cov409-Prasinococcus_capsulatus_cf.AAC.18